MRRKPLFKPIAFIPNNVIIHYLHDEVMLVNIEKGCSVDRDQDLSPYVSKFSAIRAAIHPITLHIEDHLLRENNK